jgi:hypothetical protein
MSQGPHFRSTLVLLLFSGLLALNFIVLAKAGLSGVPLSVAAVDIALLLALDRLGAFSATGRPTIYFRWHQFLRAALCFLLMMLAAFALPRWVSDTALGAVIVFVPFLACFCAGMYFLWKAVDLKAQWPRR